MCCRRGIDRGDLSAIEGVYASNDASLCCGIAAYAAFNVRVPRGARSIALGVYAPNFAFVKAQRLIVRVDGRTAVRSGVLPVGVVTMLSVPLMTGSTAVGARIARVEILASYSYVPKDEGLNGDTNRYSVTLTKVTVER